MNAPAQLSPPHLHTQAAPRNLISERAYTPRAPPNDEVRPPPRTRFLNPPRRAAAAPAPAGGGEVSPQMQEHLNE